jgi:hypothetical protein
VNRNKVTTEEQGESASQSRLNAGPQFPHEYIGKSASHKEMKNDGPVKGQVKRQEKVWETQGVKHPGLDGGKKRYATFYVWIPEREMALTNSFNPDKTKGIKKGGKVSLY